jgi:hypothetical protein
MAYDVFISYETTTGTGYAKNLKDALEKHKYSQNTFLADKNLFATYNWREKIDSALEEASFFLIIFTSLTCSSDEVKRECQRAIELDKDIMTCRWHKIPIEETQELSKELTKYQQIQFEDKYDLANQAIFEIGRLRGNTL